MRTMFTRPTMACAFQTAAPMSIPRMVVRSASTWKKLTGSKTKGPTLKDEGGLQKHKGPGPGPVSGSGKSSKSEKASFHQVHDYTIMPYTYSYTTDGNEETFRRFPLVTSKRLARNKERPRNVRMLARDFMEDSLYNPSYGYFSREVDIFTPSEPFSYKTISDDDDFLYRWSKEFAHYRKDAHEILNADDPLLKANSDKTTKSASANDQKPEKIKVSKQIWHTPTELFKPFYGQALARYLLVNYKMSLYPYHDLIIYEMGGGNGTLMLNILDYIKETQADVYSRTKYKIIEISSNLAAKQESNLTKLAASGGHHGKVEIINKSIFDWNTYIPEPCFFIALEVFDNFAHDVIRYDNSTLQPYQGYVVIDADGGFQEVYSKELDPLVKHFLKLRGELPEYLPAWELGFHPLSQPGYFRAAKNMVWPFRGNLSDPEYIPTNYLKFLYVLKNFFPEHRLLTSDFTHLKETIPGYNSPVVQTVMEQKMIPVRTYMTLQGFFDILFPTDFTLAAELYKRVCGKVVQTASHHDFLETWAEVEATSTKTGENPMLSFYRNAAFMYS